MHQYINRHSIRNNNVPSLGLEQQHEELCSNTPRGEKCTMQLQLGSKTLQVSHSMQNNTVLMNCPVIIHVLVNKIRLLLHNKGFPNWLIRYSIHNVLTSLPLYSSCTIPPCSPVATKATETVSYQSCYLTYRGLFMHRTPSITTVSRCHRYL